MEFAPDPVEEREYAEPNFFNEGAKMCEFLCTDFLGSAAILVGELGVEGVWWPLEEGKPAWLFLMELRELSWQGRGR